MTVMDDAVPTLGRGRGRLRVYLGAAPGVGKTYAMLDEGHRRAERGADVVVGFVETHGRAATAQQVEGMEVVPRVRRTAAGIEVDELDLAAVIARGPDVALVDELAHTNATGSGNPKRWEDVEALLDAGIDVVTTVNVQHLESLNDVVFDITGVRQRETVPDEVVRAADQIELVDMSPQSLRRRMSHGNIYAPEKIDAALTHFFREGNLTALRELALLWLADRVDASLDTYRTEHQIDAAWKTRERVVVALGGGQEGEALVRRGIRIVQRASGGQLFAVHVARTDGLVAGGAGDLARQRRLVEEAGGTYHVIAGDDVASAILDFAAGVNASQIVVGESTRPRLLAAFSTSVTRAIIRGSDDVDVLVVTHYGSDTDAARRKREAKLSGLRQRWGWVIAVVGNLALAWVLTVSGGDELPFALMSFLVMTLLVAFVGGLGPALVSAALAAALSNVFFTEPRLTFKMSHPEQAVAVVLLFVVAVAASRVVATASKRSRDAGIARTEADLVTTASLDVLAGADRLQALLLRLREAFDLQGLVILDAQGNLIAADPPDVSATGTTVVALDDGAQVVIDGPPLGPRSLRVIAAIAAQASALAERTRMAQERRVARVERERGAVRDAVLAAVSHDLRTPLAAIKASASALRSSQLTVTAEDARELFASIEDGADRLQALVDNLLDMSRIDAGIVSPRAAPTWVMDLLVSAVSGVEPERVELDVPASLGTVMIDGGLVERVVANLVENATRYSPPDIPVRVSAARVGGDLVITVVDRGPGVDAGDRQRIFDSFQRLGDAPAGLGVGLGLAVARGLARSLGGEVSAEETPGGGLTMVVRVPEAESP
ncbi:ATP-binding protein [Demequina lutea]|uniref:histidine kinase n=1 Tax=Demequina lutea TaxID=431489 RepID=A0A7Y9ZD75_9MICO|nr:ATP-binding protein [Demequina lutea]NYI42710.1 two-component system sensor histidine kinase KdpD [Demequina lutea]